MFKFLHNLELKWWQAGIYETAMISLGILIGARFSGFFQNWVILFLVIFLAGGIYILRLWFKQMKAE